MSNSNSRIWKILNPAQSIKPNPNLSPMHSNVDQIQRHANELINKTTPHEITAQELLKRNIEEVPWLVHPLLIKTGLVSWAGASDVGKSSLARQAALSICLRESEFLGFPINALHHSCLYVSSEDDAIAMSYLIRKQISDKSLPGEYLNDLRFIFETENILNKIIKSLEVRAVDLIVIDVYTDLYGKSLNESNQVRSFLQPFKELSDRYGTCILFLHHTGKRTGQSLPSKHNLLGSQGFESKMRLVVELRNGASNNQIRHLCIVKGNYLSAEYKDRSYVLEINGNLTFSNTNERCSYEEISTNNFASESFTERKKKYLKAKKLKKDKTSYEDIASIIGYKSKSSVHQLFKDFENME